MKLFLFTNFCYFIPCLCFSQLKIVDSPPSKGIIAKYESYDTGGNTSVVNDTAIQFKYSGKSVAESSGFGYFDALGKEYAYIKRNRDLGQTFLYNGSKKKKLKSITVKTGYGSQPAREGIFGANISLQLLEVNGEITINDNGSSGTMKAFHGFPHDRYQLDIPAHRDDYISGESYTHLKLWQGFVFPTKSDFGTNEEHLRGRFLTFKIPKDEPFTLLPDKRYAFVIMIDEAGDQKAFTLANNYSGNYPYGHGIRRSGDGTFPPFPANPTKSFLDETNAKAVQQAQLPSSMSKRILIQPGTNGYPDVDTFRDFVFYIQVSK